ncbi:hypothetical protein [Corallibacter sp.]|uniref:hypothetical protein n=1 Tax=Corallibacter sp. TaxID=2038084 RepID=UPI003A9492EF
MEILNKAVSIDTANGKADALEYRAWTLLYYYRDYEGVVRDVNLIEKITGNTYNSCWGEPCGFHKGQALYKLDNYDEAIASVKQFPEAYYQLGLIYKDLKNDEKAKVNFELAKNYINYSMSEPYVERIDEIFEYMVANQLQP